MAGIESEIVAAVNTRREALTEAPSPLTVDDALAASRVVMYLQACKITQVRVLSLKYVVGTLHPSPMV